MTAVHCRPSPSKILWADETGPEPVLDARGPHRVHRHGMTRTTVLHDVSVPVGPGGLVAVTGLIGAGESTPVACLAGLEEPDRGTVPIRGERMDHRSTSDRDAVRVRSVAS